MAADVHESRDYERYLRIPIAYEIWSALSKAFYDGSDEMQVFNLNHKAFITKQNGKSLSESYGELTQVFQELDHRDKVIMKDPDDIKAYCKSIERLRVHIFLVGLDDVFEQVRGEILLKETIPDLDGCYALVRREVVRKSTLKGEYENSEASAMLVGYPDWWDPNHAPRKTSNKISIAAITETKTEDGSEKSIAMAATTTDDDVMYFAPETKFQEGDKEEIQILDEIQTLDYEYQIAHESSGDAGAHESPGDPKNSDDLNHLEMREPQSGEEGVTLPQSEHDLNHLEMREPQSGEEGLTLPQSEPEDTQAPCTSDIPPQSTAEEDVHELVPKSSKRKPPPRHTRGIENDSFYDLLESAVKSYQYNFHLNITGQLDAATADQMMIPRCGVADVVDEKSGKETQNVTAADIKIGFFPRSRGDNSPFDGRGGTLAHAYAPTRRWFHSDADERWPIKSSSKDFFDVESVAVHEIGHLLGLEHSTDRSAIRYPSIGGGKRVNLTSDDIQGIQALYNL
ncbi:hypothetical protein MRB53_031274 [Persea americana]|uniref:Uncharacterized protein n=1 Tax=Persea americana TaxID=3435 RepID=A0ACC2KP29_PERAE|nr:hypothetical protein MRB53_031274 [Persea americana]